MSLPYRTFEYRCLDWFLTQLAHRRPDPLDGDRLLEQACRQTGLQDFGDHDFLEPYHLFLQDLKESSRLTALGRQIMAGSVLKFLENRLCLQAHWQRFPSRCQQELKQPLYIMGFPRSGTTLLFNVLAAHPEARALRLWEVMKPVRDYRRGQPCRWDRRVSQTRWMNWQLQRQAPRLKTQHPMGATEPEESTWLLSNTLMSPAFSLQAYVPHYQSWLDAQPPERWRSVYHFYRQTLQGLQDLTPQQHWVMRSPAHLQQLAVFLEILPEATVVIPIRDPAKVVGSCCSLVTTIRGLTSNHIDMHAIGRDVLEGLERSWQRSLPAQQQSPRRVIRIRYEDLVRDPARVGTVIYERLGYSIPPSFAARVQAWLASHPPERFGTHQYNLEDFGLTTGEIHERLSGYAATPSDLEF